MADQDPDQMAQGLSQSGSRLMEHVMKPPSGMESLPSGMNPLWRLAAKQEGISPFTGYPMLDPKTGQPLPPWHFQQGPILPPVPTPGQPLP